MGDVGDDKALRRAFAEAGGRAAEGGAPGEDSIEQELRDRIDAGRAAWPDIALDEAAFVRHLAGHSPESLPPRSHAADLWIACACATGVAGAALGFERAYRPAIERAVARVDRASVDEGTQAVLVSLLVAEAGARPRIAEYAGRAALRTWLATVAANAAMRLHRRRDDQPHDSLSGLAEEMAHAEPEIALAKARHGADLETALRDALANLDARQRMLLRVKHVKGWRLERVATMYRVSRATAARMITAAHQALSAETKRLLRERLKVSPSELESLVKLLQSQLEVSLVKLLGADDTQPEG
jgi:RNA polymerase sigma-70 factor (ECF subfamily)